MKYTFTTLVFLFIANLGFCQTANISGVINAYTTYSGHSNDTVNVGSTSGFSAGDKVLIIQMQGATINQSNGSSFGTVTNLNNAGNYEYTSICEVLSNQIVVTGVERSYTTSGKVQVIRVPEYVNAVVTGSLSATPWNGKRGGSKILHSKS